jgi:hypothetical protein
MSSGAEETVGLERREGRRERDDRHDPGPAERERDDERRDEDGRAEQPLAWHGGGPGVQRPKRRVRRANSRTAASKASGPKSGQRTSLE